jgi:triosephosphate isomerase
LPYVVINLKAYFPEGTGGAAEKIAKVASDLHRESGIAFVVCPMAQDIQRVAKHVDAWAQDADPVEPGAKTGSITLEGILSAGAKGLLINHAECQRQRKDIEFLVNRSKSLKLRQCICTKTPDESAELARLHPEFIAVEPPDLIGGDISVTTADPGIVTRSVKSVKSIASDVKVLCGAGVKNADDLKAALELGTEGVLLASGIVKAKDPERAMRELISKI